MLIVMRVLAAGNDVARLAPLKAGRARASAMGIGIFFAQEGVLEFAVRLWPDAGHGAQPTPQLQRWSGIPWRAALG
jgi:hypothetical protein